MTQPLQLSPAQLAQAEKAYKAKVDAKKLEIHALSLFRDHAPREILRVLGSGIVDGSLVENASPQCLEAATNHYFTAKLNQAVIELQEMELQLKAIQSMSNRVQPAVLTGR